MSEQLTHAEVLGRYCGAFVDELVAAGVENVCLCPGSRSTPLALTFARHPGIKLWMHLDERSCAYFALGMAKASGKTVAILCSSGTAAVNFAPAIVEAFHSHVPLIVLTADRPPELQGLGANQTIDQQNLYGSAAKWFVNLPLPEASGHMLRYARTVAGRAVATSLQGARGPVHLNFQFREPLVPAPQAFNGPTETASRLPFTPRSQPAVHETFSALLKRTRQRLIVCGPATDVDRDVFFDLAHALGAPVIAEPMSGLRTVDSRSGNAVSSYESFLRNRPLAESLRPDLILRFGAPPTSRTLSNYLQLHRDAEQIVIAPPETWPDPDLTASTMVHSDAGEFCRRMLAHISPANGRANGWLGRWQEADAIANQAIRAALDETELTEPAVIVDLAEVIRTGSAIVAGNSMPVRDLDTFWPADDRGVVIHSNRGASGIDGVVSTAFGVAACAPTEAPTVLVIGDLSFYHDMNGLLAAQRFGLSATIVLINNDGGGIFSFLAQHEDTEHFEQLWGTPHGLDFSHVAGLYGVGFQRVTTRQEYRDALKASFDASGVQVIEVNTDREENLKLHERIWEEVARAVDPLATATPPLRDRARGGFDA